MFYWNTFIFVGYRNDRFFSHKNPYTLNVTQQCRCSPMLIFRAWATCEIRRQPRYAVRFNEKSNKQHENRSIYTKLTKICTTSSPADSLRASSPIWASETSLARTRVLARLASLAQIGELARRLPRGSTDALEFLKCPGPKLTGSACAWRLPVWIGLD